MSLLLLLVSASLHPSGKSLQSPAAQEHVRPFQSIFKPDAWQIHLPQLQCKLILRRAAWSQAGPAGSPQQHTRQPTMPCTAACLPPLTPWPPCSGSGWGRCRSGAPPLSCPPDPAGGSVDGWQRLKLQHHTCKDQICSAGAGGPEPAG